MFKQYSSKSCIFHIQYVIQATTGGGNKGDIAIDDVAVLDGECEYIVAQSMSDKFV